MKLGALVVGPTGLERHVLVSSLTTDVAQGHAVAQSLLGEIERLGGSGYFAAAALQAEGVAVELVTNTGDSEELRQRIKTHLEGVTLRDSRAGTASAYLSLWDTVGAKQLYVRSGPDPVDIAVDAAIEQPDVPVIALSLRSPASYSALCSIENAPGRLFVAPNQTLLAQPTAFSDVARSAALIMLSENEVKVAAAATTMSEVSAWFRRLDPRARLVVTRGAREITIIDRHAHRDLNLSIDGSRERVLAGGDTFLALTAIHWNEEAPDLGLIAAARATATRLPAEPYFETDWPISNVEL